ncbi:MAG TPA: glycosyl hydrolase-related protein [Armatimonadota bacterium]|jgi:alpha-mannosidase
MSNTPATTVVTWYANHFDLIWRRGWQRDYEYMGSRWRSYAGVEDEVITRCLRLAVEQGAAFLLEQSLSLRVYLQNHPESEPVFRQLAAEGRFELLGAGEAIIDSNMCHAETLIRNFASGLEWGQKTVGLPTRCANEGDAFGTSAQLPQVYRGCGLRAAEGFSYSLPDAPYWRGLDGSTVLVMPSPPGRGFFYDHCYHEPCRACHGFQTLEGQLCPECEGSGFDLPQNWFPAREPVACEGPWAFFALTSEEMLPDPELVAEVKQLNASQDQYHYEWGTPNRYAAELYAEALAAADNPPADQISSRVENNPTQTGCLVSRIRSKQAPRAAEGAFYAAEALVALAEMQTGKRLAAEALQAAWLNLPVLFFHDAVTGTHNDPAHLELLDMAAEVERLSQEAAQEALEALGGAVQPAPAEGSFTVAVCGASGAAADHVVTVALPEGAAPGFAVTDAAGQPVPVYATPGREEPHMERLAPVGPDRRGSRTPQLSFLAKNVPAGGCAAYTVTPRATAPEAGALQNEAQNEHFRMQWDEHGVTALDDAVRGENLARAGALRVGELIMEQDCGDPWGTRDLERRARQLLAADTKLLGAQRWEGVQEVYFGGRMSNGTFGREPDPRVFGLWWYQTWRMYDGLPRVDVELEVFWRSIDHRLRIAFPTGASSDTGLYSIPGGVLERERYDMTESCLWSPNGDWPALYFAATRPEPGRPGLAVLNTGTPSARIEDGAVMYSLVRGVGDTHCLGRYAQDYPMPTAELMDGGYHRYRFALMSVPTDPVADGVMAEALRLNAPPVVAVVDQAPAVAGLSVTPSAVELVAIKRSFDGAGWAARLVNYSATSQSATVTLPRADLQVSRTNYLEREAEPLAVVGGQVTLELRGHEMTTLRLEG